MKTIIKKNKININDIIKQTQQKMENLIFKIKKNLSKLRINKFNINILNDIKINYLGKFKSLNKISNFYFINSRIIKLEPYKKKDLKIIEKYIRKSKLDLNPLIYDNYIKIKIPNLTEEKRKEIVKIIKKESENTKIYLRNIRRKINNDLKKKVKNKLCSKDNEYYIQNKIQNLTNDYINNVNKLIKSKEKEILTI